MKFPTDLKIAVITSRFNEEITGGLLSGAKTTLLESGLKNVDEFKAPGAFEIPLIAQTLAKTGRYHGIVCLGCVIKGDTAHFEFISLGATIGIQQVSLATGVPVSFGIITTYTEEQALDRSRTDGVKASENKGREAALACLESIQTLRSIQNQ